MFLLTDVFETFISTCLGYYGLDPRHYFNSPELSWYAMLKMTGIKLKLISDIEMHLFIEKRMTGSISYIAKKYSITNNKYMKSYDVVKKSNLLCIWMQAIYMVGQRVNIFLMVDLNG